MDVDFEKSHQLFLFPMKALGTHPETPINIKWFIKFCLSHGPFVIFATIVVYNSYINSINNDFSEACKNGVLFLTYFGASLNNIILLWYRGSMKNLLDMMRNDYKMAGKLPRNEQLIFEEYVTKKIAVCKLWFILFAMSLSLFCAKTIVLMIYYSIIGEPKMVQLYDLVYPDCIENRKDELPMFLAIYLFIFAYGMYAGFVFMSFLPFGPVLMLHACGHLEIIKQRIETLFTGNPKEVNKKLNDIVKRLQYTYNFVETVKECFKVFYEVTLKISALALPVTFYALLEGLQHGVFSLEFTSFILSGMALSSTPCYYSDMLLEKEISMFYNQRIEDKCEFYPSWAPVVQALHSQVTEKKPESQQWKHYRLILYVSLVLHPHFKTQTQGEEVRLSLYECGWERQYNRRVRSTILLLLIRCSRPIAMQTMFTPLCLYALTDMFQQAYTIFNLMNAVLN